jgi:hypothetical protein
MISTTAPATRSIFFERRELDQLLTVYGRFVAAGLWRDYAMDALPDRALFSIFRRTSEAPLYQIQKAPADARRQGAFSVRSASGLILRRGHDLGAVLKLFDQKLIRVVAE